MNNKMHLKLSFYLIFVLYFATSCSILTIKDNNEVSVGQWDIFEGSVENTYLYNDPYTDVTLNVTYIRPDNSTIKFWGFYDGDSMWRFRIMPDQKGRWKYNAEFSDGSKKLSGEFICDSSSIPGLISADEANSCWFGYKGGKHILIRSLHVGDCFFANEPNKIDKRKWNPEMRKQFLDWAQEQGYNMLSIASFFLNRQDSGRGLGWATPALWNSEKKKPRPDEYNKLEEMLNDLSERRIIVYPFAGFFGRDSNFPKELNEQNLYIKYTIARLAPYWNLLFMVGGPEPLMKWRPYLSKDDLYSLASKIDSLDIYDHLLSVHNSTGEDQFINSGWANYSIMQGPKTLDRDSLYYGLMKNRKSHIPLYAQETLWAGNKFHPNYSYTDLRKNAIVINMAASAINFAENKGLSSTGFSGYPDLGLRTQRIHDILKKVWDFFDSIPFYEMQPRTDLVDKGFCLAEEGKKYLVYLPEGGTVNVSIKKNLYNVTWINANSTEVVYSGLTINGKNLASPQYGDDWFLHITKNEN